MRAGRAEIARRAAAAAVALLALSALAQTMYKWTDKDGKTQYADQPPKGFSGPVTKIETDPAPVPVAPVPPIARPRADGDDEKPKAVDINKARRERRERLEAQLERARARVALARKALAEGGDPGDGEMQVIQQRHPRDPRREGKDAPRGNCMSKTLADGKPSWTCPTIVPGDGYFDRQKSLEEAVRKAEEALEAAELAYRRGVD